MPPILQLDKMPLQIIRPLCLIDEQEIIRYAEIAGYRKQIKTCPFEYESTRTQTKKILSQLAELNPEVRDSLWAAMENIKLNYLPQTI
jgi:tRNA(Ile)-lysidine synthase TilS/MesJ